MNKQEEAPIKAVGPTIKNIQENYNKKLKLASDPEKWNQEPLHEFRLTWAGKLFFASVAAYIASDAITRRLPMKVRGNKKQIKALADAIVGSKEFQREMKKPGATVDSVMDKMNFKNMTAQRFKRITGQDWPV